MNNSNLGPQRKLIRKGPLKLMDMEINSKSCTCRYKISLLYLMILAHAYMCQCFFVLFVNSTDHANEVILNNIQNLLLLVATSISSINIDIPAIPKFQMSTHDCFRPNQVCHIGGFSAKTWTASFQC